jgi:hypothetical protein
MKRICRPTLSRPSPQGISSVLSHARIVTDPKKLARLYAAAEQQKRYAEGQEKGMRRKPTSRWYMK